MDSQICPKCGGSGMIVDDIKTGVRYSGMRRDKKLTQREVARSMGISQGYLCDLEHGRRGWTPKLQDDYNEALGGKQ